MKKKRFLLNASYADSILSFRGKLIDALIEHDFEVYVTAPNIHNTSIERDLYEKGVRVFEVPLARNTKNILKDAYYCFSLWRVMRRIKPQYVLSYTIKPVIYGSLISWLSRIPSRYAMITGLGYLFSEKESVSILTKCIYMIFRQALSSTTTVFFQNHDDPKLLSSMSLLKNKTSRVVLKGSGVDLDYFYFSELPLKTTFLLIGRFLKSKGLYEYAEAAKQLKSKYSHIDFLLVGWIDEGPDAIAEKDLQIWIDEGIVISLGRMTDVRSAIKRCSVFVLPSYHEGMPRSVLEAMSMGRSIITTDAPGCRETVIEERNGILVKPKCVDSLVTAMERFIIEPRLSEKMGRESRLLAEEFFDFNKITEKMLTTMHVI